MKVYLFYLLSDNNRLYAYTTDKEYADRFLTERNPDLFKRKKKEFDDPMGKLFLNSHKKLQLFDGPLTEDGKSLSILMTYEENDKLTDSFETLIDELDAIRVYFTEDIALKEEWCELINRMTIIAKAEEREDQVDVIAEINTLSLFYHLFKNTFHPDHESRHPTKF